jgi:hypothetical protein
MSRFNSRDACHYYLRDRFSFLLHQLHGVAVWATCHYNISKLDSSMEFKIKNECRIGKEMERNVLNSSPWSSSICFKEVRSLARCFDTRDRCRVSVRPLRRSVKIKLVFINLGWFPTWCTEFLFIYI